MSAIVALEQGVVQYPGDSEAALKGVDFAVYPGERIGLTGDNGSGKTTLLMALAGLRSLDAGRLLHYGAHAATSCQLNKLRRDIGIVFQNAEDQLFSPTVLEDVAFGPLNLGYSQKEARERALNALDRLGERKLACKLTHTLSGGQKRIAALATVLSMQPKVLLLDEPTNDLDTRGVARLESILLECGLALVLVSHDHAFLSRLVNRKVHLEKGKTVAAS